MSLTEDNKNNGYSGLLGNRLLVDYRVLQYRCRHLALGMQGGITEEFSGRISPLSNVVYFGIGVFGAVSFSKSLKGASKVSYLMTGKIFICLEAWPL